MKFIEDKGTGYLYCYNPKHYCANGAGKVLEHVYVMSKHIGRPLEKGECVHHIDRDRKNNQISNLLLLTITEHAKLHAVEDRGTTYHKLFCEFCSNEFEVSAAELPRKYCSVRCSNEGNKAFIISAKELEELVWKYPTTKVAKILGVSDVAVAKRCKRFGIEKPPRGYWRKVQTNKLCPV